MRLLALHEDDTDLFKSQLNRTLYALYRDNVENLTLMWEKQGRGYWVKFCISLRSVLQKEGLPIPVATFEANRFEEFFIELVKILTGKNAEAVHAYVKDVVGVSRYHQLFSCIPHSFMTKLIKNSTPFERLFGSPLENGNIVKMLALLPLHLRAVGCFLILLKRWLASEGIVDSEKALWHPPESWNYGNQLRASYFEDFLKKHWGAKLLSLINVRAADICWWNCLPQNARISTIQRHTSLGRFIANTAYTKMSPLIGCDADSDEIFHYSLGSEFPRGIYRILRTQKGMIAYTTAMFHGLYLVDNLTTFHPFSQVIISFTSAAFSGDFWYGEKGVKTQMLAFQEANDNRVTYFKIEYGKLLSYLVSLIGGHLIRCHMAMKLNSRFFDTLYQNITWTSPVTLLRLPWNIPLFANWLELLLTKIYEFDRVFMPICHFPLRRNIISLVELIYKKVSEARFIVKACLIIVDGISIRQKKQPGRCYGQRKLLCTMISRLVHIHNFFETVAYRVLDVILRFGWNKEERQDGETCLLVEDRVKVDLASWCCVPDIEKYYIENYRNVNYWITNDDWALDTNENGFDTEAFEMLLSYEPGFKNKVTMEGPYTSKFCKKYEDKSSQCLGSFEFEHCFEESLVRLLVEDGWLPTSIEEIFSQYFENVEEATPESELYIAAQKMIEQVGQYGHIYFVASCLLADTVHSNITGQTAFATLQRCQTFAILADTGAILSAIIQSVSSDFVACPPSKYFKQAAAEIQKHSEGAQLNIEEAKKLLQSFDNETPIQIEISTLDALTAVKVPNLEEMQMTSVGTDWLKYLEKKRVQLLQLVYNEHFTLNHLSSKRNLPSSQHFPLCDVLEYRLVEEMAAMQKCLELGGLYYGPAYGLCRLLAHRFTWLQQSFTKWSKSKPQLQFTVIGYNTSKMEQIAIDIRIRITAALIPLQALFCTYISKFRTTHPITEMTFEMLYEWADVARLSCSKDFCNSIGNCLTEYCIAVKRMGCQYIEQMLAHCNEVWVVTPFCSDPSVIQIIGSISHAQQIVSTFTQLYLMTLHTHLSQKTSYRITAIEEEVESLLVHVTGILRHVELQEAISRDSWDESRQMIKKPLRTIWSNLLKMKSNLVTMTPSSSFPKWTGNSLPIWNKLLSIFLSSQCNNVLQKIAFSEFINTKNPHPEETEKTDVREETGKVKPKKSKGVNKNESSLSDAVKPDSTAVNTNTKNKKGETSNNKESSITKEDFSKCSVSKNQSREKHVPTKENITVGKKQLTGKAANKKATVKFVESDQTEEADNQKTTIKFVDSELQEEGSSKLRTCMNCKSVETARRMYKKCMLCKKESWIQPRFYCSQECQVKDWKEKHSVEHKRGEVVS